MGNINMDVAPVEVGVQGARAYEKQVNLSSAGNSDWILIPRDIQKITVSVVPGGGASGKVQTTTDTVAVVKAGVAETAVDWDSGLVASAKSDSCDPVTAIRFVQSGAGTVKGTVRAQ